MKVVEKKGEISFARCAHFNSNFHLEFIIADNAIATVESLFTRVKFKLTFSTSLITRIKIMLHSWDMVTRYILLVKKKEKI